LERLNTTEGTKGKPRTNDEFLSAIQISEHSAQVASQFVPAAFTDRWAAFLIAEVNLHVWQPSNHLRPRLLVLDNLLLDGATHDLGRIGTETKTAVVIKFFDSVNQCSNSVAQKIL